MKGVLFLCAGDSGRSRMAEGFARRAAPPGVAVHGAGVTPAGVSARAVQVMAEVGVDIGGPAGAGLAGVPLGEIDLVVTLCGDAAERCPTLPGAVERLHWPLQDPARAPGREDEVLRAYREVRDEIAARVRSLFA